MSRATRIGFSCAGAAVLAIVVFVALGVRNLDRQIVQTRPLSGGLKGIEALQTAQMLYDFRYGHFASSTQELGPPESGPETASAAGLIESALASGEKDGYRFTLLPTPAGYTINAAPVHPGTGSRTYFSDQSMRIHQHAGPEPATLDDPVWGESAP